MSFDWFKSACVLVCVALAGGCAQTNQSTQVYRVDPTPSGQACPGGKVQVCDRRKSVGCRCQSGRHLRAYIGA